MNNLEKAKELKEKYEKAYDDRIYLNGTDTFENDFTDEIKKEAKALKEKIENDGCDHEYMTGTNCRKNMLCYDCQQAIKICEEILK